MVQVPFCEIEIKVNRLGSGCNENDWFKQYSTSVHFKNPFVSHWHSQYEVVLLDIGCRPQCKLNQVTKYNKMRL